MCGFYGINNLLEQPNKHYPTCTEMTLANTIHYSALETSLCQIMLCDPFTTQS